MAGLFKKTEFSRKKIEETKAKAEETRQDVEGLIRAGHEKSDFDDLVYSYNLLVVAYGSLGNSCAIIYYLKEIDPEGFILPEEIKDIQFDIEMNIQNLEESIDNWQGRAIEIVDGELQFGSKFVIWKHRLSKTVKDFKKLLNQRMSWIRKRLTPNKEEIRAEFIDMVKALSTGTPQVVKESDAELENYRHHLQSAQDVAGFRDSIKGKLNTLKIAHENSGSNILPGIAQYEEFIDLEIYTH